MEGRLEGDEVVECFVRIFLKINEEVRGNNKLRN